MSLSLAKIKGGFFKFFSKKTHEGLAQSADAAGPKDPKNILNG
jgi:hypothetical protein